MYESERSQHEQNIMQALALGDSDERIYRMLTRAGLSDSAAGELLQNAHRDYDPRAERVDRLNFGAASLVGGLLLAIFSAIGFAILILPLWYGGRIYPILILITGGGVVLGIGSFVSGIMQLRGNPLDLFIASKEILSRWFRF